MNRTNRKPYYHYYDCPFCGTTVVIKPDYDDLREIIGESEAFLELFDFQETYKDICPHTAFRGIETDRVGDITEEWEKVMKKLALKLMSTQRYRYNYKDEGKKEVDDDEAAEWIMDMLMSKPEIVEKALGENYPEGNYKVVRDNVVVADGKKENKGPTYFYIFIK